jgi:hypothetical protein
MWHRCGGMRRAQPEYDLFGLKSQKNPTKQQPNTLIPNRLSPTPSLADLIQLPQARDTPVPPCPHDSSLTGCAAPSNCFAPGVACSVTREAASRFPPSVLASLRSDGGSSKVALRCQPLLLLISREPATWASKLCPGRRQVVPRLARVSTYARPQLGASSVSSDRPPWLGSSYSPITIPS